MKTILIRINKLMDRCLDHDLKYLQKEITARLQVLKKSKRSNPYDVLNVRYLHELRIRDMKITQLSMQIEELKRNQL